jgi:membrane-associated PAP2 superfamily phosphatase
MELSPPPVRSTIPRAWLIWPALLAAALVVLDFTTDSDRAVTRFVYDAQADAFPLRNNFWIEVVMHHWAKYAVITLGALVLGGLLLTYVLPALDAQRRILVFLALALVLAPLSVSVGKAVSPKHCPWDVDEFGGLVPYTRIFEAPTANVPPGHCFPAGHASTGFALMAFYFAAHARRMKKTARAALALGIAAGFVLGWGRVLQGAHFMSHVFWSGLLCWVVMVTLYVLVLRNDARKTRDAAATGLPEGAPS